MKNAERNSGRAAGRTKDIDRRTFAFACRIVTASRALPNEAASWVIARQLVRSGTSVGANLEEAEAAHSTAEFIQKVNIARRESREALYWLRIIAATAMIKESKLAELIAEAEEIVKILTTIVRNARKSS